MITRLMTALIAIHLCLSFGIPAIASDDDQQRVARSFAELPNYLDRGDIVFLEDESGREFKARVEELAPTQIYLTRDSTALVLSEDDVHRMDVQYSDSLMNGVLMGGAIGGGIAAAAMYAGDATSEEAAGMAAVCLGAGLGIGVGLDALVKGRKLVYSSSAADLGARFSIRPILARGRKGVALSVSF